VVGRSALFTFQIYRIEFSGQPNLDEILGDRPRPPHA
jgi:hypothetical protein